MAGLFFRLEFREGAEDEGHGGDDDDAQRGEGHRLKKGRWFKKNLKNVLNVFEPWMLLLRALRHLA